MTHWLAKIGGWAQFLINLVVQLAGNHPHSWTDWVSVAASAVSAIAIHAASSTDGTK